MSQEFKTYYEYLKSELEKYRGSYDDYIFYLPELFKLLSELLNTDIDLEDRNMIACALGYFVAPKDVINEEVHGPAGYVDDLFICCYVLRNLKTKYGREFLESKWHSSYNLPKTLTTACKGSARVIKEEKLKKRILDYVGLK